MTASVRARITILAALVVAATLVTGGVGLIATLRHELTSHRDELSRARAVDLAQQAQVGDLPRVITDIGEDSVAQLTADDGSVLAASSGLRGQGSISPPGDASETPSVRTLRDVPDDDETENYRVWVLVTDTPSGPVTVIVGSSLESVDEAVRSVQRSLLVGVPLTLILLAFSTRLLVGRALRPVEDIRAEVAAISAHALDRRVPVPAAKDEVARLAHTMNGMLDRLETSSRRQQEFVADASHELQSPLAAFRVQLEVALQHPEVVEWPRLARDLLSDSDGMERLVRDLLFLAQEDAGHYLPATQPMDLDVVVLDEVARLRHRVSIAFDTRQVSAAPLVGSRDDLTRLTRNLLDNAVAHAVTEVRIALSCSAGRARLLVSDDGPGIPAEHHERVFERFSRVEGARNRPGGGASGTGTGLGLAIARVIVLRHQGTIHVESGPDGGASLVVQLPASS